MRSDENAAPRTEQKITAQLNESAMSITSIATDILVLQRLHLSFHLKF
jgi:hypothetical protein